MSRKRVLRKSELSPEDVRKLLDIKKDLIRFQPYFKALCISQYSGDIVEYDIFVSYFQTWIGATIIKGNRFLFSDLSKIDKMFSDQFNYFLVMTRASTNVFSIFLCESMLLIGSIKQVYLKRCIKN